MIVRPIITQAANKSVAKRKHYDCMASDYTCYTEQKQNKKLKKICAQHSHHTMQYFFLSLSAEFFLGEYD